MKLLVCYDIIETNSRNEIVDLLFDFGFKRLQYSVFLGELSRKRLDKFIKYINQFIDIKEDSFYIFNFSEKDFNKSVFLGKISTEKTLKNDFYIF